MSTNDTESSTRRFSAWIDEVVRLLPIRTQFILAGNIRDEFLIPRGDASGFGNLYDCLWQRLATLDAKDRFTCMVIYNPIKGLYEYGPTEGLIPAELCSKLPFERGDGRLWGDGTQPSDSESNRPVQPHANPLRQLFDHLDTMTHSREYRVAIVIDDAARLSGSTENLSERERLFFTACQELSLAFPAGNNNTIFWLVNREQDLPTWFSLDSDRIAKVTLPLPSPSEREAAANIWIERFADARTLGQSAADDAKKQKADAVTRLRNLTHGMPLVAMDDLTRLAKIHQIPCADVDEAILLYKFGKRENPWRDRTMKEKILLAAYALEGNRPKTVDAQGRAVNPVSLGHLGQSVKGQERAIEKVVDILMRSYIGLSGAHSQSSSGRPRGILFLAGPTGVGKTELAKALTRELFGEHGAYIRFDMSEFSAEHSDARLIGAPPGYVGYEAGGELTQAIKRQPFSVLLFDEIEKANGRILDKFLQIIEDGRLTDGRGETVNFSESILIFTSNKGMRVVDEVGQDRGSAFDPKNPPPTYEVLESTVLRNLNNFFVHALQRPELLNRIGENFVVFDFIRPEVAKEIFDLQLANTIARVARELGGLALHISPESRDKLRQWCTESDTSYLMEMGGRGISNKLETCFINPLSRALNMLPDLPQRKTITVVNVQEKTNQSPYVVVVE
ncbi:MAG: ATP-dependent Clp protease ATP-binding subunit [Hydrogenophilales bacterium]|nr:ATP-dependent Clp protease ATP-binding subunit [Hydrogenophilales bacterium]